MELLGSQALIKALESEGVEVIFGIPGGVVLPIFDALYDSKKIKFFLMRHEQAASHAADGYARVTGKVGVCLATSGPGATNIITGITNAHMDSVPFVAITGQVRRALIGKDSFQETDMIGITSHITKHNFLVKEVNELLPAIRAAFYLASTGRKGAVLVDIPVDISTSPVTYDYPPKIELVGYKIPTKGHPKQVREAAETISNAEKPVILAGGGVISSDSCCELVNFAEKNNIPVVTSLMGKGVIPETHPLSLGMVGMHGTYYANMAVSGCDVLIAIGTRFSDRVTGDVKKFATNAKIIHIDIDPAEIGKNVKIDIPIVGDAKLILTEMIKQVKTKNLNNWLKQIHKWKTQFPMKYEKNKKGIAPQYIVEAIWEATKGKAIITTEVGQNQMWASQFYKVISPRTFLTSGGLGTMGFGFPAAIGAQIGKPDKKVIDIAGDGSFMMNIQDLASAVFYKIPVKVFILNNGYLGMVRQWQELFYKKRYCATCLASNPDFVKVAKAFGAEALKVDSDKNLVKKVKEIINNPAPVVVDCWIRREENVFPMVVPGGEISKMILG